MTGIGWNLRDVIADIEARGTAPGVIAFTPSAPTVWSAAALADTVRRLSAGLRDNGLRPDDRIALWAPNAPEWIAIALSVIAAGRVLVPVDDGASGEEAERLISAASATWLFAPSDHVARLETEVRNEIERIILLDDGGWRSLLAETLSDLPVLDGDRPAVVLATSGTTGAPKLFTLSHGNLAVNVRALADAGIAGLKDKALVPLPLHHAYPLVVGMLTPVTAGTTIVLPERITGPAVLTALREAEVTIMIGVPRLYEALLGGLEARFGAMGRPARWLYRSLLAASDLARRRLGVNLGRTVFGAVRRGIGPSLRTLVSGGAHLPANIQRTLQSLGWQVLPGYGLAETASVFTAMLPGQDREGSVGRPLANGEAAIDAPDEKGVGEIVLRGPNVTAGYLNNPEANRLSFTPDGWFRTGDLGRIDEDGFVFVAGRRKEIITLAGGKKVNPEDLEKRYAQCDLIEEIAILEVDGKLVALVRPDHQALKAVGVVEPTRAIEVGLIEIGRELQTYERLTGVAVAREALPRTRLGKLRRFMLPDLYDAARAGKPAVRAPDAAEEVALAGLGEVGKAVIAHLRERFPDRAIRLDSSTSLDLGLDSLGWMGLTLELEQHLGCSLTDAELAEASTVADLIERVSEAKSRPSSAADRAGRPAETEAPARWLEPRGPLLRVVATILFALNRLVMRLYFGLRVEGVDHLPRSGPYLVAPNHVSDIDPLVIAAALPYATARQVFWAGDRGRLFYNRAARLFCRIVQLFPVDEFKPNDAIDSAATVLSRNGIQVWFPEGWRSPDGSLQEFRPGVGVLLQRTGTSVVPTHIDGAFAALPRGRRIPKPVKVLVRFGEPVRPEALEAQGVGESSEMRITSALRDAVVALAPEQT